MRVREREREREVGSRAGYFIIIYSECVSSVGGNRNRNTDEETGKEI